MKSIAVLFVVAAGAAITACNALAGISRGKLFPNDASTDALADAASARPPRGACGLDAGAFCEDFEAIDAGVASGKRAGPLDETRWSVARLGPTNYGQGMFDQWVAVDAMFCGTSHPGVLADDDIVICNDGASRRLAEAIATNPGHLAMRIRQPFDFAAAAVADGERERTPTIAFDVDATGDDSTGSISVWITDEAVPAPFHGVPQIQTVARNAIGFEFARGTCDTGRSTLSNLWVYRGGAPEQVPTFEPKCFGAKEGSLNHIEIRLRKSLTEVYASDAGDPSSFQIIQIVRLPMPFTRGYVSFEHYQGTGAKTFHWDNMGFDGPLLPVPQSVSVRDALVDKSAGHVNLGYIMAQPQVFELPGFKTGAQSAHLDLNAWLVAQPETFTFTLNGDRQWSVTPPSESTIDARILSFSVKLDDLREDHNYLEIKASSSTTIANIDLTLDPP